MSSPTIHFAGPDAQVLVVACEPHFTEDSGAEVYDTANRHLPDREGACLVLDFTDTVQINSMGLTKLLSIRKLCDDRGAAFVLAGLGQTLVDFLSMLKMLQLFNCAETLDEAIARAVKGE